MSAHLPPSIFLPLALALIGLVLTVGSGCDDFPPVQYENQTGETIEIFKGGSFFDRIEQGQTIRIATSESVWQSEIRVLALDGTVLFEDLITWDELEEMDFSIVLVGPQG